MLLPLRPAQAGQLPEWALIELQGKVEQLVDVDELRQQIGALQQKVSLLHSTTLKAMSYGHQRKPYSHVNMHRNASELLLPTCRTKTACS